MDAGNVAAKTNPAAEAVERTHEYTEEEELKVLLRIAHYMYNYYEAINREELAGKQPFLGGGLRTSQNNWSVGDQSTGYG